MPPPTAASKRIAAPVRRAVASELRPVMGDDVLVRGHHRLAHRQRGADQRPGRLVAAHQLDHHVDGLVGDDVRRSIGHELGGDAGVDGRPTSRTATAANTSPVPSPARSSADRSSRAPTTSRPTVPAPRTPTRRRAAHGRDGSGGDIGRMVADRPERPPGERRRLHSRAMTTDLAPAPAPIEAPVELLAHLLGDPATVHLGNDLAQSELCPAPVRVRGDLLHRRLPRADEHPRPGRDAEPHPRDGGVAARPRARPRPLHAVRPEPPPGGHRARLAAGDGHPGQLAGADADVQGEEGDPARRHQPRAAHLPSPPGGRHRHLQGLAGSRRSRPGAHLELSREIVRAFNNRYGARSPSRRRSTPRRRSYSEPTACGR